MVSNEKEAVFPAAIRKLRATASQALVGGPWYVTILTSHGTDGVVLLIRRAPPTELALQQISKFQHVPPEPEQPVLLAFLEQFLMLICHGNGGSGPAVTAAVVGFNEHPH